MSVKHYTAACNKVLAKQFALKIKEEDSIFSPIFVGISNSATKDWLVEQVAEHNTISANFVFKRPLQCIEIIHQTLGLGNRKKEMLQSSQLNWIIYSILKKDEFAMQFPVIAGYFDGNDLKRFALAEKIAGLFTTYQESDPSLISKLEDESSEYYEKHVDWQAFIWKEVNKIGDASFKSLPKMYDEIVAALNGNPELQKLLKQKIPALYFYGNIPYTAELVQLLDEVGKYISIQLFRLDSNSDSNPSRFYETLSGFQKKQALLFSDMATEKMPIPNLRHKNTLLSSVQQELSGLECSDYSFDETDDSIQIANNYSVYREVEALWNYLITQFIKNQKLEQRDICVFIPSLEKYAPAIKAVFGKNDLRFDYVLFNTSYKIQDSPFKALLALYAFDEKEFTAKKVFGLLEYKFIREKFGFSDNLETIKRAINLSNIRHGIDGDANLETEMVSWRYGLKRLIYGGCIEKTDANLNIADTEFYPVAEFEENDFLEVIRLNQFVETLHEWVISKEEPRSLFAWIQHLEETFDQFIACEDYDPILFNLKLEALMKVRMLVEEDVHFTVLHYHLKKMFDDLGQSEKMGYGGIRFVSPDTHLAVPAKISCFLGMNGNEFPRISRKLSFDLLSDDKEYSAAETDKNLFLNFILDAEEKLYISYIGQSVSDNSSIPPSTLTEELIYVLKKRGVPKDAFIHKHPLHFFSTKYNQENSPLVRFSNPSKMEISQTDISNFSTSGLEKDSDGHTLIPLYSLIRFIEDPIRHYYNWVLGIYYSNNETELSDCEPFNLNKLDTWNIKDELLNRRLKEDCDDEMYFLEKKRKGKLPFKNFGIAPARECRDEVGTMLLGLQSFIAERSPSKKTVDFVIDGYRIKGEIEDIYDDLYLFFTASSDKPKYRIRTLINFMVLSLFADEVAKCSYNTKNCNLSLSKRDGYENDLLQLCQLFARGSSELIHFTSDFSKLDLEQWASISNADELKEFFLRQMNNRYGTAYPSEYFKRELNNGFLAEEGAFEKFKTTYCKINGIIEQGFN